MKENTTPSYDGLTVHINAKLEDIAPIVLMPGDPLRAKHIAEKYLDNAKIVSSIRNNLMYSGEYKGKRVTIAESGMGIPSIGIYSYELYHFYDVKKIIRLGSTGGYGDDIEVMDIILVSEAFSRNTSFSKDNLKKDISCAAPSEELNNEIIETAKMLNIPIKLRKVYTSDTFYNIHSKEEILKITNNAAAVEMESYGLFINAIRTDKKAACLLTVSDHVFRNESLNSKDKETKFDEMVLIALNVLLE